MKSTISNYFKVFFNIIIIAFLAISSMAFKYPDGRLVEITGTAINLKLGAALRDSLSGIYYVEDIYAWDKDIVGKSIIVKGILKVKKLKYKEEIDSTFQTFNPKDNRQIKIIKNPKWEIIQN